MAAPCGLTLISPPLLTFTAPFSIVNPLSGAPAPSFSSARIAISSPRIAPQPSWVAIYSFAIVAASLYVGAYVLECFGVSIPVLRLAGGMIVGVGLFLVQPHTVRIAKNYRATF
jgi:multiple antibiotic resistance protein